MCPVPTFANKTLSNKPHFLHLKMGMRSEQLTFGSTDLNQVDHILVFQKLEDLDFPQGCNGELGGKKTGEGQKWVSAPQTKELARESTGRVKGWETE